MSDKNTLLIVWVYYPAAGHFAEAIEAAANYHVSNSELSIHIAVNSETVWKLDKYCPWVKAVYPIDVNEINDKLEKANCLINVPKIFDYVIFPNSFFITPQDYNSDLLICNRFLHGYFVPAIWGGNNDTINHTGVKPNMALFSFFRMQLPETQKEEAKSYRKTGPLFTIMLEGAQKEKIYPSLNKWKRILRNIKFTYPDAVFIITGISDKHIILTKNKQVWKRNFNKFINAVSGAVDCYDVGIERQLSYISESDVFISPHTGFAFLALCLGTPWLVVSGVRWPEPLMARTPFYSSMPKCSYYPCAYQMKSVCKFKLKHKLRAECMANIGRKRIKDLLRGTELLLSDSFTFEEAVNEYERRIKSLKLNPDRFWRIKRYREYNGIKHRF